MHDRSRNSRISAAELDALHPNARAAVLAVRAGCAVFPAGDGKVPHALCPRRTPPASVPTAGGPPVPLRELVPPWLFRVYRPPHQFAGQHPGGFWCATADERLALLCYWERNPDAPPGVPVPPGVLVIDVDSPRFPARVSAALGRDCNQVVLTPGGGRHYWFRLPTGEPWMPLMQHMFIDEQDPAKPGRRLHVADWKSAVRGYGFPPGAERGGGRYTLATPAPFHADPAQLAPVPPDVLDDLREMHRLSPSLNRRYVGQKPPSRAAGRQRGGDPREKTKTAPEPALESLRVGLARPGATVMGRSLTLKELAALVRGETYRPRTVRWRRTEGRNMEKFSTFAGVYPSGEWTGEVRNAKPARWTRLLCYDLDHGLEDGGREMWRTVTANPATVMLSRSVSGAFWALVRAPDRARAEDFGWWWRETLRTLGWQRWDQGSSGLMKRRFLPHDPHLFVNWNARPVPGVPSPPPRSETKNVNPKRITLTGALPNPDARRLADEWTCSPAELRAALTQFTTAHRGQGADFNWWHACVAVVRVVQAGRIDLETAWNIFDDWSRKGGRTVDNVAEWVAVPPPGRRSGETTWRTIRRCARNARRRGK